MGVPTHRIEIRKTYGGHDWSNDYQIEAPSFDNALSMAIALLTFERAIHMIPVLFTYYRVSTVTIGDRVFRHTPISTSGLYGAGGSDFLPLFNTMRFDLQTADSDPCRKYFRCPLPEGLVLNEVIHSDLLTAANTAYLAAVATFPTGSKIVSSKGHNVVAGYAYRIVQMRQLHRHRRKKIVAP